MRYVRYRFCRTRLRRKCVSAGEGSEKWSGRKDLNLRPPGPEPGALARLRYAPTVYAQAAQISRANHTRIAQLPRPRAVPAQIAGDPISDRRACQTLGRASGSLTLSVTNRDLTSPPARRHSIESGASPAGLPSLAALSARLRRCTLPSGYPAVESTTTIFFGVGL